MKYLVSLIAVLAISGCAALSNMSSTPSTGVINLPSSTQLLAACEAEKASGKTGLAAPDCVAWTVMDNNCKTASMAPALAPLAQAAEFALPQAAVPASMLNIAVQVDMALCTTQGFYSPVPAITVAPVPAAAPSAAK